MGVYTGVVRPLLFRADPERAHDLAVRASALASRWPRAFGHGPADDPRLAVEVAGIHFATPLGLAAGFDKSARAVPLLSSLGFGHVEVGSISADPSAGNPRPRLFRLAGERAIVVHYGVPNDGAARVAARLRERRAGVPLGINVVSTNRGAASAAEPDDAVLGDYVQSVRALQELGDYVCLNLSCPNTRDGVGFFADRSRLRALLERLGEAGVRRPLFIKIAPFASEADIDSFLEAVDRFPFVSGFSVNLPPGKPPGIAVTMPGAVSGPPCAPAALRTVGDLYRAMDRSRFVVIGSGGVRSGADAYAMIRRGASLVQLYTALVYDGPGVVRRVTRELGSLLGRDGFAGVGEAVGVDVGLGRRSTAAG
jgi:dihydroorotate dehydrogenase (fumarate)/dihydroorotate dehydrogenase